MAQAADTSFTIEWHHGPRDELRGLFALAEDSPAELESYLHRGRVLVARTGAGEIAGQAQLIPTREDDVVELKSLAVHARFRRRGLGRSLVARAVAACRAENARAVTVATAMADVDNLRFYQRCGFRAVAVERDAFTTAKGYAPDLEADGIAVRDGIRFALELREPGPTRDPRRRSPRTSGCHSAAEERPLSDGLHAREHRPEGERTWSRKG